MIVPVGEAKDGPASVNEVCEAVAVNASTREDGPVRVIVPPFAPVVSAICKLLFTTSNVIGVCPDVLEVNVVDCEPPAPTPIKPSFVALISDAVRVKLG